MSYQVLARKWRPRTFDALVGQEHVVKALTHALEQKRLHHAYLFTGTRGVGKTTIARILAKSLNCETGISATPCGTCSACTEIDSGRFVDLMEIDAATNTGIDDMRELQDNAAYVPTRGRFKVIVIDEVHMLSKAAFNSMLKTFEEPPDHIKFVLATTDPQKIPVTVLSRCLQFNLKQMPAAAISSHLARVLAAEKINGDQTALRLIAAAAKGSMRDALSLLDQAIAFSAGDLSEESVRAMLGTVDDSFLFAILRAVAKNDARAALGVADDMESRNLSFDEALQDLASLLHRVAFAQSAALPDDDTKRESILELANLFAPEEVQLYYQIALHGRQDLPFAPDGYAGFTMSLLRMLAFRPDDGSSGAAEDLVATGRHPNAAINGKRGDVRPMSAEQRGGAAQTAFDGNWPALAKSLRVSGMTRQLAQQSELKNFDGDVFELCVPAAMKHLTDKGYLDKLKEALRQHFGRPVRISVDVGGTTGNSAQDHAVASIQQDAFVQGLVENMDATIIPSSIRPVNSAMGSIDDK